MPGTLGTIAGQVRLDVRQAVAGYAALRAQNARTVYALRGSSEAFLATGKAMTIMGAVGIYAFAKVIGAAAEFERKMDFASAVTGANAKQMQQLSEHALQLGKDTIYSAGQVADGFIELAKAGVSVEDVIGGIGKAMTDLGAAGDIPLAESGQIITSTVQQFDLAARDAIKVTNILAGAANASIVEIADLGVSLKYVGGVANAAGLTFEDTATAISLLGKAGIRGSTAGTSLRQMIVSLGGATGPAREALEEIGILTEDGSNAFYTQTGRLKPLAQVYQILQDQLDGYNQKEKLAYLRTIFNNRALSAAAILTREGAKGFRQMNKEMAKTTAADVASERLDNLSGDIEILRGNIETFMIEAGGPFQKTMRKWVQALTALVQAFSDLDPATQETILMVTAIASVVIFLMGIFNIIIGLVLKFAKHLKALSAAAKFVWNILKSVWTVIRLLLIPAVSALAAALGISTALLWAIIAVIALLVVGVIYAYKNLGWFRDAVNAVGNAIWTAMQAIGAFFKLLFTDPGKAWDQLRSGAERAVGWIIAQFAKLPGLIGDGLSSGAGVVGDFIGRVAQFFLSLPGRVLGIVASFVGQVLSYLSFRNVGYVIGFMIGTVVRLIATMPPRVLALILGLVGRVISLFASMAPRVGYLIGFMVGRIIGLMLRLNARMIGLVLRLVGKVLGFFAKLPERVAKFLARMVVQGVAKMVQFSRDAPRLAGQLVDSVINFFKTLPARTVAMFLQMVNRGIALFTRLKSRAVELAQGLKDGVVDTVSNLPSLLSGIVGDLIDAFKDKVSEAFNAAKDFAGGLWEGFKDGVGIDSPSYMERAMWQITKVMDEETKKMSRKTMEVQELSKRMAETQFTMPGMESLPKATQGYARLASMQARNDQRARTLLAASGKRGDRAAARRADRRRANGEEVPFRITNWQDGRGMMRDIAQDVVDEDVDYDDTLDRMG